MADEEDIITTQPATPAPSEPQYVNAWDDILAEHEKTLERQKVEDQQRIDKLSKGRAYWIGANMLANVFAEAINAWGTGNGAPAMQLPEYNNEYMKLWKEADDRRHVNYQRMKDQYDRLRVGQLQREQQIADKKAELQYKNDMDEKTIQGTIASLKANYGDKYGKYLTEEQWRAWAEHKITPDVVRKGEEGEAFNTRLEQRRRETEQDIQIKNNAANAEIQKQIGATLRTLQSYDPSITRDEVEDYYNSGRPSKKIAEVLRENNINTTSGRGKKGGTMWWGDGKDSDKYNVNIGGYEYKAETQGKQDNVVGQLRSKVLQAIKKSEMYKNIPSEESDYFTNSAAAKWDKKTLMQYIDYFGLLSDESFVESLKGIGFTAPDGTADGSGLSQKEVDAFNTYFGSNSK